MARAAAGVPEPTLQCFTVTRRRSCRRRCADLSESSRVHYGMTRRSRCRKFVGLVLQIKICQLLARCAGTGADATGYRLRITNLQAGATRAIRRTIANDRAITERDLLAAK